MKILKNYRLEKNEVLRFQRAKATYNSKLPADQSLLSDAGMVEKLFIDFSDKMKIPKKL